MRLEMIDRDQRRAVHERDRLGGGEPDDHPADQAGSGGRRDPVERGEVALRLPPSPGRSGGRAPRHARARRSPAPRRRRRHARRSATARCSTGCDRVGPIALDDRGRGLVAGRFDAQHDHRLAIPVRTRPYGRAGRQVRRSIARFDGAIGFFRAPVADRHARLAAGAGAGPYRARPAGGGAWLRAPMRSPFTSSRRPATGSSTGRCRKPAARACSPRRSRRPCSRATSTSPCIPPRTCRPSCRTGLRWSPIWSARTCATCSSAARPQRSRTCRRARWSEARRCAVRRW